MYMSDVIITQTVYVWFCDIIGIVWSK